MVRLFSQHDYEPHRDKNEGRPSLQAHVTRALAEHVCVNGLKVVLSEYSMSHHCQETSKFTRLRCVLRHVRLMDVMHYGCVMLHMACHSWR